MTHPLLVVDPKFVGRNATWFDHGGRHDGTIVAMVYAGEFILLLECDGHLHQESAHVVHLTERI
jgi:hypothetical protein